MDIIEASPMDFLVSLHTLLSSFFDYMLVYYCNKPLNLESQNTVFAIVKLVLLSQGD